MKSDKTVLMIDDDPDDQEIFCETLDSIDKSIKCIKSYDSRQAIKTLTDGSLLPDYIFLDLNMPLMDGFEVLQEIKKHKNLIHIPVFIYTTSSQEFHRQKAVALGASLFITKPFSLADLKKILEDIFIPLS